MSAIMKLPQTQPHPTPKLEEITPAKAKHYLSTMIRNRPPSDSKVFEYAIAMDEKRWAVNGETIKFDGEGRMFDGQHRCLACVLAEKPFTSWVIKGVDDPRAYSTVDVGMARSAGHIFGMSGWGDPKTAAGITTVLLLYRDGNITWSGPSAPRHKRTSEIASKLKRMPTVSTTIQRDKLQEFANSIREDLSTAIRYAQNSKAKKFMSVILVGALYFLFRQKDGFEADRFFTDLAEGVGLVKSDPVYALREKLIAIQKSPGARLNRWAVIGIAIKAWNKRRAGEKLLAIKIAEKEAFPKVK